MDNKKLKNKRDSEELTPQELERVEKWLGNSYGTPIRRLVIPAVGARVGLSVARDRISKLQDPAYTKEEFEAFANSLAKKDHDLDALKRYKDKAHEFSRKQDRIRAAGIIGGAGLGYALGKVIKHIDRKRMERYVLSQRKRKQLEDRKGYKDETIYV